MAKPSFKKTLAEVLGYPTLAQQIYSENTGKTYTTDVVPSITALSIGSREETTDGKFKYSIVDTIKDLEYTIKAPNPVEVKFGTKLKFKNIRGGDTPNGIGWFAADSVEIVHND